MTKTIMIDPVTRIEGHSKITIKLDDQGEVTDARFHVTQFRGFEKLVEGRPFYEMPSLTARTCGICPVSHLMASAKACDAIMAVKIPETAANLRRVLNLAQMIQSHALSFFHLSSPDLLFGMDAPPAKRNIFGVAAEFPELAKDGIWLRKFGQETIEWMAGKRVHPAWVVPGGVSAPLTQEVRDKVLQRIPEAIQIVQRALAWYKSVVDRFQSEIDTFANFPTLFMGLVGDDGMLEFYDGTLKVVDSKGKVVDEGIKAEDYADYISEAVEPDTYLKSPYYKIMGYPEGIYRVGPLARLNVAERCGMPLAAVEMFAFHKLAKGPVLSSFHYHHARLIEILYGLEKIEQLLNLPDILSTRVRATAGPNQSEGVGISSYILSLFPDQRGPNDTDAAPANATGLVVNLHSYSPLVIYPWGWTNAVTPNATGLRTLGGRFSYFNRYTVQQAIDLYAVSGELTDWIYGELGVAAYTFEMGTAFFQSCASFESTVYPSNRPALYYAAKACRQPYLDPAGPDVLPPTVTSAAGPLLTLSANAASGRSFGYSPLPAAANLTAARYSIDNPSWIPIATTYAMTALDGSFNSTTETVTANIDTTGWAPGRHTIFVEARTGTTNWGVPTAVFADIAPPLTATLQSGNLLLRWPSITNRLYTLLQATNLAAPFTVLATNLPGQPPTNTYPIVINPGASRFYRLQLQP